MNPTLRLSQVVTETRAIAEAAQKAQRDFTPEEQTRVRALLDEAAALREQVSKAEKSRKLSAELGDFLREPEDADRTHRTLSRGSDSWTKAMLRAVPTLSGADFGTKGLTIPPTTSFLAPAPKPIVAANVPFGHLLDVINVDANLRGPSVTYLRSINRVRASRITAPGALKPSKNVTLEKVEAPALTIAVLLEHIRKQDLDDYTDLVKFLDFELQGDVLSTLDQQMLLGTGPGDPAAVPPTTDELTGIFYTEGIGVQEFSTTASASLRRAMAKVENEGYENTAVALNPTDYAELELELNTAGDYRGNIAPATPGPRRVWGVPVVSIPAAPEGLAVVGDFEQVSLWIRETIQVTIAETNGDDFAHNEFTARAEMRAAFGVATPQALSLVALTATAEFPATS